MNTHPGKGIGKLLTPWLVCSAAALSASEIPQLPEPEQLLARLLASGEIGAELPDSVIQSIEPDRLSYLPDALQINIHHRETPAQYDNLRQEEALTTCREFLRTRRDTLQIICNSYGADPAILTSIWFTESRLGQNTGEYPVQNLFFTLALLEEPEVIAWNEATALALEPERDTNEVAETIRQRSGRKKTWALRELNTLLSLYPPATLASLKGSWAGATGIPQFLPTSIEGYGVDWNGDGVVNLLEFGDAAASTANYLRRNGWRDSTGEQKRRRAVWSYNHSQPYVDGIMQLYHQLDQ